MAALVIRGVRKAFGEQAILHGIDLDIADGEFVVFVGPSGCGKSTLLRTICGLEELDAGSIAIGARDMTNVAPAQRGIAMVFQSYALYPHMTVYDNMAFGLKLAGTPAAQIREKVMAAAASLRIEPLLQRKPKELSGGQRQRVAIGRAIVRHPEVFLFDEPLSNQVEAMTLADRIVVLRGGKVEQVGAPLELYNRPGNLFVAGFMGSPAMNFIEGTVRAGRIEAAGTLLAATDAHGLPDGGKVTLGLRAEHVLLARQGSGAADGIAAKVQATELLGDFSYVYLQPATGGPQIVVRADADASWQPGDTALVTADPSRWHLFDANGLAHRPNR